jgi:hypothetical protein
VTTEEARLFESSKRWKALYYKALREKKALRQRIADLEGHFQVCIRDDCGERVACACRVHEVTP